MAIIKYTKLVEFRVYSNDLTKDSIQFELNEFNILNLLI